MTNLCFACNQYRYNVFVLEVGKGLLEFPFNVYITDLKSKYLRKFPFH